MWDIFSVVLAGLVSFMSIVGIIMPQWVTRRYQATDFGGRFRVGLLEYTSEYRGKNERKTLAEVYFELTVVLELLALFFSIIVFFLLFLKVFMGRDDKRVHLGAAGLSALAGLLMIIGPFVFCLYPEFNRSHIDKPEEMGKAMFICIAAGALAIVNTLLLGAFHLNKKLNSVPDMDEKCKEPCIEQKV